MKTYLEVIEQALIFFPLAAMIMTVPYVIYNYRKYGSVLSLRILIVYSFVLYMLCTCFLVILPLPSFEAVARMNGPEMQMIPFMFVSDMAKDFKALFQVLFNVLMTVPFGIYLRYYFRCSLRKTILCSFLLSLFYELTQLTGLYFIYPGSYRLFDVDDLMANTLGGLLGYGLLEPLKKWIPSREKIDQESFRRGKHISMSRRLIGLATDLLLLQVLLGMLKILLNGLGADAWKEKLEWMPVMEIVPLSRMLSWAVLLFYFAGLSVIGHGQTPGMRFMKMCLESVRTEKLRWFQPLLRYGSCFIVCVAVPCVWNGCVNYAESRQWMDVSMAALWKGLLWGVYTAGFITVVVFMALHKRLFFETWSGTRLASTIESE